MEPNRLNWHLTVVLVPLLIALGVVVVGFFAVQLGAEMAAMFITIAVTALVGLAVLWLPTLPLWEKALGTIAIVVAATYSAFWVHANDRPILNLKMQQVAIRNDTQKPFGLDVETSITNSGRQVGDALGWKLQLLINGSNSDGHQLYGQVPSSIAANEPDLSTQDFPPKKPIRGWLFFDFSTVSHEYAESNFVCGSPALDKVTLRLSVWDSKYQHEWSDSKQLNELGQFRGQIA
jgi:hypothetical protein